MNNNHDHRDILGPIEKKVNIRKEIFFKKILTFFLNINLTNNLNECTFKILKYFIFRIILAKFYGTLDQILFYLYFLA